MPLKIQTQRAFEKDLKKMKRRNKDLFKLKLLLEMLEEGAPLPEPILIKLLGRFEGNGLRFLACECNQYF